MTSRLILVCGLTGAGKTTLSKKLAKQLPATRLCPDDWLRDFGVDLWDAGFRDRLERLLWKHAQELLQLDQTVILEYGFWAKWERDEKHQWAREHNIPVELLFLDVPFGELLRRVQSRHEGDKADEIRISREQLQEFIARFQPPDADEMKLYDQPRQVAS